MCVYFFVIFACSIEHRRSRIGRVGGGPVQLLCNPDLSQGKGAAGRRWSM